MLHQPISYFKRIPVAMACILFPLVLRAESAKAGVGKEAPDPGVAGTLLAASRPSLTDKKARPYISADSNYFQGGAGVIVDEDGTYHMFYSRWPRNNPNGMYG